MALDSFEKRSLESQVFDMAERMKKLREGLGEDEQTLEGIFPEEHDAGKAVLLWLGEERLDYVPRHEMMLMKATQDMFDGRMLESGERSLGIEAIHSWKINLDYALANLNQHAGYAAGIIGTIKENFKSMLDNSSITAIRVEERPDLFQKKARFADKIRVDGQGTILERVRTVFAGDSPESCLAKLRSKRYDKFFEEGRVDKIEIPKGFYKEITKAGGPLDLQKEALRKQLDKVRSMRKEEAALIIEKQLKRLEQIRTMVADGLVSREEAGYAVLYPERYISRLFSGEKEGLSSLETAFHTALDVADTIQMIVDNKISPVEAYLELGRRYGKEGTVSYSIGVGAGFVSTLVAHKMSESSCHLVESTGKIGIPGSEIFSGIQILHGLLDFGLGYSDGQELAEDLEEALNQGSISGAIGVAGSAAHVILPAIEGKTKLAGTERILHGMVGIAAVSNAYLTAVEQAGPGAEVLAEKAQSLAAGTIEAAREAVPQKVDFLRGAINSFASENGLPISV